MEQVRLTREPIDIAAIANRMKRYDAGALALFVGTVRAEDACSRQLLALDYSAYEEMALEQLSVIRQKSIEQFTLLDACIVHRLGRLTLGEASIAVAAVAAHRAAAIDACRCIVDQVKTDVPIWKKDIWSDGAEEWVDPTCSSD